jgi:hypothetical protein
MWCRWNSKFYDLIYPLPVGRRSECRTGWATAYKLKKNRYFLFWLFWKLINVGGDLSGRAVIISGSATARLLGITDWNPAGGVDVCLLWMLCVVFRCRSLRRSDPSSEGVLPIVVCLSVISKYQLWRGLGPLGLSSRKQKSEALHLGLRVGGNWCLIIRRRSSSKCLAKLMGKDSSESILATESVAPNIWSVFGKSVAVHRWRVGRQGSGRQLFGYLSPVLE